jgi:hypothetical protein
MRFCFWNGADFLSQEEDCGSGWLIWGWMEFFSWREKFLSITVNLF